MSAGYFPDFVCASIALAAALVVAAPLAAGAADGAAPKAEAIPVPAPTAVRLTGELSESVWSGAPAVDGFVEREPHEGGVPSQRTEFRVAYDKTTLYVKVRAWDTDAGKIVGYLTRRDGDSPSDWIHVMIDSYHDRRTAYEFAVNPAGVKTDAYWYSDWNRDSSWDAVWDVSVSRDAHGWTAEFRIPFSQLRFTPGPSRSFGFAVSRQIGRLNETETWPLLARSVNGYVSQFGELDGLAMTASPKRLELAPYTVATLTTQPTDGNPLLNARAPDATVGLDLKYALTPGLTLTSTLNPDFGQVEADPAVVNLTAFETFFPERRPFFVEGSGNFQFNLDCNGGACSGLFYSRRIGRTPQGNGNLPGGADIYTRAPAQTTILGATKLTGRIGQYSIGAMQAVAKDESAGVADLAARYELGVEPLTSYSVGRVRREFANQSSIGFMLTSVNRRITHDLLFLPNSAVTGGVDWDWRLGPRYGITGYWAGSALHGDTTAIANVEENSRHYFQRPDLRSARLDPARTSLAGTSGKLSVGKIGGERVHFDSTISFKSPGFDVNDIGYLRRADERSMSNWFQLRSDRPTRWFRSRMINVNQGASWNYDGDRIQSWQNVNAHAVFANNWQVGGGYNIQQASVDDRVTRGGPVAIVEGYQEAWYYLNSDNRRAVSLDYNGGRGADGHGSSWVNIEPGINVRPMSALQISASISYNRNIVDSQWVNTITDTKDHAVFGHLKQTTMSLTGRVNYTLSPTLSLQLYAQPFVSGGYYTNLRELVDGRNPVYAARYAAYDYPYDQNGSPDFNVKSFRTTNVLRWEYKPGSTLFVVWQQARENDVVPGDFRFGRDARDIFAVPPHNVFLVKLAYWLNY